MRLRCEPGVVTPRADGSGSWEHEDLAPPPAEPSRVFERVSPHDRDDDPRLTDVWPRQNNAPVAGGPESLERRGDEFDWLPHLAGSGETLTQAQEDLVGDRTLHRLQRHIHGYDAPRITL